MFTVAFGSGKLNMLALNPVFDIKIDLILVTCICFCKLQVVFCIFLLYTQENGRYPEKCHNPRIQLC